VEKRVASVVLQLKVCMLEATLLRSLGTVFHQTVESFDAEAFNDIVMIFSEHFRTKNQDDKPPIACVTLHEQQYSFFAFAML
jgi:N-acetyl-anhydromuramyl-L-alanine amidase AmpD